MACSQGATGTVPIVFEHRRRPGAAGYVDRILKGEKLAELAVQAPTKFEMVIDIKTAKTLGIAVALRYLPAQTR
jgi:ABC-type uncharacterized transport system substrate-binding protein